MPPEAGWTAALLSPQSGLSGWSTFSNAGQGAWVVWAGRCGGLRWVERWFYGFKLRVLVERFGAGLAAVAVKRVALFWKLARMDFLTIRRTSFLTIRVSLVQI